MRKLKLSLDELQVATFATDAAASAVRTVNAFQTEPASVPNPCTGTHCTYPVKLCRPHNGDERPGAGKR
ncbi:MAG TPA: hypothetical protein VGO40_14995 [Longimicrobium sp.]|jgi:hypothetical protein|nr:hypothetical protein [Longimicrobium sp.]